MTVFLDEYEELDYSSLLGVNGGYGYPSTSTPTLYDSNTSDTTYGTSTLPDYVQKDIQSALNLKQNLVTSGESSQSSFQNALSDATQLKAEGENISISTTQKQVYVRGNYATVMGTITTDGYTYTYIDTNRDGKVDMTVSNYR